jgi:hypothetical protein
VSVLLTTCTYYPPCRRCYCRLLYAVSVYQIYGVDYVILCAPCAVSASSSRALLLCASCRRYYCCSLCAVSACRVSGVSNIRRGLYLLCCKYAAPGPLLCVAALHSICARVAHRIYGVVIVVNCAPCRCAEYTACNKTDVNMIRRYKGQEKVWI